MNILFSANLGLLQTKTLIMKTLNNIRILNSFGLLTLFLLFFSSCGVDLFQDDSKKKRITIQVRVVDSRDLSPIMLEMGGGTMKEKRHVSE